MGMTVSEISDMLRKASAEEFDAIERSLAADTRKGVASALAAARRRIASEMAEQERLAALYEFDRQLSGGEGCVVVGLDEVGRGAVAGPLAVGAVVLRPGCLVAGLNDSKKIPADRREQVAAAVKEAALAWAVAYVEAGDIDRDGMAACLRVAFKKALSEIESGGVSVDAVLVDGNPLGIDPREHNVVKGDSKSASIAAASVVAKVERDALMSRLSSTFPQYGFSDNKGYAAPGHIEAIREHGLTSIHRVTFCRSFLQETLF